MTPVLIDVDRSVNECDFQDVMEFQMLKKKYNSLLYALEEYHDVPTDIYRIDYRQLAIMLMHILNPDVSSSDEYNNVPPPNYQCSHNFLRKLYDGEFDRHELELFLNINITIS